MNRGIRQDMVAECFGTFALVFSGTSAIVINDLRQGAVTSLGIGLTFGMIVTAMVLTLGKVSGAHLNPAVTLGLYLAGRLEGKRLFPFWISQCAGAFLGSGLVCFLFPYHLGLGATLPVGGIYPSFVLEMVLTAILMVVILGVACGMPGDLHAMALAVGAVIALEAIFAGPISGASMNPARSLAPGLLSGQTGSLWIYWTAPFLGAGFGVALSHLLFDLRKESPS
jgi:aquaporin Z